MPERYRKLLMWALDAALVLAAVLLQTVLFGRVRFWGAKLALVPVVVACVSMHLDAEQAGLFGLAAGFFWYCSGADGAGLVIVSATAAALLCSWLCVCYLRRNLLSAALLSALALLVVQGLLLAFRAFTGVVGPDALRVLFVGTALSLLVCVPAYYAAAAIRRIYRPQKI